MKIVSPIKQLFGTSEFDEVIIQNEIKENNLQRIFYLGVISIPIIFTLIAFYYSSLHEGGLAEYLWRVSIIQIHSVLLVALLLGTLLVFVMKKRNSRDVSVDLLAFLALAVTTAAGIATATADQLVTPSIAPFILSCTITACIILIRPLYSFIFFLVSYGVFYFSLPLTQPNEAILLSNRLDALVAIGVGFMLSLILWKNALIRYRQNRLIQIQKREIENNYEKLVGYANELDAANAAKDKFFSIIAHDLRGLITSTITASDLLIENEGIDETEKPKIIKLLNTRLRKTSKLLENLLAWSTSQVKQFTYSPIEINLYSAIEENTEILNILAEEKKITLANHVSRDLTVIADKEMINTVFRNLISNAIKFTRINGMVEIEARIAGQHGSSGDYMEICVKDNGVGMSEKAMNNLFQIDKKVTSPGTANESGSGLGLILCKDFIEKQKGKIWLTSELGKGTCFTFTLPTSLNVATIASYCS